MTSVISPLISVQQVTAINNLKSEQMEAYLAVSRKEIADALDKVNVNNVPHYIKLCRELNIMSFRLHDAHGELESKLAALPAFVGGGDGQGPPGLAGMTEILQKLQA